MNHRLRQERTVFLLFLGSVYVCLMCALPIVTAAIPHARYPSVRPAVAAEPTFEQLDKDRNGYVNREEARGLPGLLDVFDDADRRPDGRLDKVEYAKALALRDERRDERRDIARNERK